MKKTLPTDILDYIEENPNIISLLRAANKGPIDVLKSSGATKNQIISFGVFPQILPSFVANNLYILDRNARMATMLGIVGAGGIGYELQSSFRMFEYEKVSATIILIFITIFVIDYLSSLFIRSKIY